MLIALLIFSLIRTLRGVPLSSALETPDGCWAVELRDTQSHFGEHAVSDIILSCFATIFACTWSSVHPNVPATTDCWWTCFKRQFMTMVYALLAPEAITAWALSQRLAAREITDKYNVEVATGASQESQRPNTIMGFICATFRNSALPPIRKANEVPRWTLAHGFFLQMGGFMLSDGGQPIQTLTLYGGNEALKWQIKNQSIDPPFITEEDIKDRSKGDAISKTLIIMQTMWFIVQCIARWSSHLPVTELEVVTLGFAMLNGITYGLWWHKPQNVGRPIFLEIKRRTGHGGLDDTSSQERGPQIETGFVREALVSQTTTIDKPNYIWRKVREDFGLYAFSKPWKLIYLIPLHLIGGLLRPLGKLADYVEVARHIGQGDLRVPMFYSNYFNDSTVYGITATIGILFGSVHLIPSWFSDFASVQEMWLWRSSAIVIMVGPVFLGLWEYFDYESTLHALLIITLPLYIVSRIVLLTLSLTSLRSLPLAAFQTIEWTTFIPHI